MSAGMDERLDAALSGLSHGLRSILKPYMVRRECDALIPFAESCERAADAATRLIAAIERHHTPYGLGHRGAAAIERLAKDFQAALKALQGARGPIPMAIRRIEELASAHNDDWPDWALRQVRRLLWECSAAIFSYGDAREMGRRQRQGNPLDGGRLTAAATRELLADAARHQIALDDLASAIVELDLDRDQTGGRPARFRREKQRLRQAQRRAMRGRADGSEP